MSKIKLEVELEYDPIGIHGYTAEGMGWFFGEILADEKGQLLLHSNEIGDTIGTIRVIKIELNRDAIKRPEGWLCEDEDLPEN